MDQDRILPPTIPVNREELTQVVTGQTIAWLRVRALCYATRVIAGDPTANNEARERVIALIEIAEETATTAINDLSEWYQSLGGQA